MDEKRRVALVSSQRNWGGGEQVLACLGRELERLGHDVLWVIPRGSVLHDRLETRGSAYRLIEGRHPSPGEVFRLRREFKERSVEILHANDSHAISWCGAMTLGKLNHPRVVGVKHTVFDIKSASRYNWLVDRLVCVSRSTWDVCFESGISEDRLRVVHGGMDVAPCDRPRTRQAIADLLHVNINLPLFCAVGSLIPCKGYDTLIEAAAGLRDSLGDFRLVICGEGAMREELARRIVKHRLESQVLLLGFCEDPNRWIAAADVFVHPSRSEGLSLVTIAAQQLGTPVVASEVGGLREVMRCRETSRPLGWIMAAEDAADLAGLMADAYRNHEKRVRLGQAAQRSARSRFGLSRMVEGYLDVYDELFSHSSRPSQRRTVDRSTEAIA